MTTNQILNDINHGFDAVVVGVVCLMVILSSPVWIPLWLIGRVLRAVNIRP